MSVVPEPSDGSRPNYVDAVTGARVAERLEGFDWRVVGTPPLGIALASSDIDIVCHTPSYERFADILWRSFSECVDFSLRQWTSDRHQMVCDFVFDGWNFQIFGDQRIVAEQSAWRHFVVEKRLLAMGGASLRQRVLAERAQGLKTEPAFAKILGLKGDPFFAMEELFESDGECLRQLINDSKIDAVFK